MKIEDIHVGDYVLIDMYDDHELIVARVDFKSPTYLGIMVRGTGTWNVHFNKVIRIATPEEIFEEVIAS